MLATAKVPPWHRRQISELCNVLTEGKSTYELSYWTNRRPCVCLGWLEQWKILCVAELPGARGKFCKCPMSLQLGHKCTPMCPPGSECHSPAQIVSAKQSKCHLHAHSKSPTLRIHGKEGPTFSPECLPRGKSALKLVVTSLQRNHCEVKIYWMENLSFPHIVDGKSIISWHNSCLDIWSSRNHRKVMILQCSCDFLCSCITLWQLFLYQQINVMFRAP